SKLQICAFDTGQANFIAMRKGNEVVIMDAGKAKSSSKIENEDKDNIFVKDENSSMDSTKTLYKIFQGDASVSMVFISHPHTDHYNFLSECLFTDPSLSNNNIKFYLGGKSANWTNSTAKTFLGKINEAGCHYYFLEGKIMSINTNGVIYQIFGLSSIETLKGNSLSQLIKVSCGNMSILFTGDADGGTIKNLQLKSSPPSPLLLQPQGPDDNDDDDDNTTAISGTLSLSGESIAKLHSNVVFLPHHGSRSHHSDLFQNSQLGDLFFICSDPNGHHKLPRGEIGCFLNSLPDLIGSGPTPHLFPYMGNICPRHPIHDRSYCSFPFNPNYHEALSFAYGYTKKPLYITSATCGGLYYITLDGSNISVYNCQKNGTLKPEVFLNYYSKSYGGNRPSDEFLATPFNERHLSSRQDHGLWAIMGDLWATIVENKKTFIVSLGLFTFTTILISTLVKTIENERKHDDIAEGNEDPVESAENDNTITTDIMPSERLIPLNRMRTYGMRAFKHPHKYMNVHPMSLSSSPVIPTKNAYDRRDEEESFGIMNTNMDQRCTKSFCTIL
ncbi:MAG: hypothetical protein LBT90_01620, partial [Holosporaceae bacterium]|nr:hypothetical protein [Holosporaceae bacterium]